MKHMMQEIYQENAHSWAIICFCGWKEKGISENQVRGRLITHIARPNR